MSAGLRAATAVGRTSGRCCSVELGRIVVGFDAHRSSAFSADVVVLVSARENEQELRPCRRRSATLGAEQAGRLKLSEALLPGHRLEFYTGLKQPNADSAPSSGAGAKLSATVKEAVADAEVEISKEDIAKASPRAP